MSSMMSTRMLLKLHSSRFHHIPIFVDAGKMLGLGGDFLAEGFRAFDLLCSDIVVTPFQFSVNGNHQDIDNGRFSDGNVLNVRRL